MSTQFTEERALWLYQHYRWLEKNLPLRKSHGRQSLVLPAKHFFPDAYLRDHASAATVFRRVQSLMGMSDWPCHFAQRRAIEHERQADLTRGGLRGQSFTNDPAGTFSIPDKSKVVITYSTTSLEDPIGLVATLALEPCH